jgi:hypothetical protein
MPNAILGPHAWGFLPAGDLYRRAKALSRTTGQLERAPPRGLHPVKAVA